jgi:hypothetical protein
MPYKLIVLDTSTNLGRFVLLANDAGRVQIRAHYSCLLVILVLAAIAVGQLQQLSPDSFPDQIEIQRARFFGNGSRPRSSMLDRQNYGNHICFFCIVLADCPATHPGQFHLLTKE